MTTCVRKDFIETGRHKGSAAIFISFKATEAGIDGTAEDIVNEVDNLLKHSGNPDGSFVHSKSKMMYMLVFDGDDPMRHQDTMTDIMSELVKKELITPRIIVRCGAQYKIEEDMAKFIYDFHVRECYGGFVPDSYGAAFLMFEIDIKLGTKKYDDLINSEAVFSYMHCAPLSYYTMRHNGGKMRWFEIDKIEELGRENDFEMPMHICPTDDLDEEELDDLKGEIFHRGYYLG